MQWTMRADAPLVARLAASVVVAVLLPAMPLWADFDSAKKQFLEAVAGSDVADIVEALDSIKQFDQAESAELLVQHGLNHEDILVQRTVLDVLKGFKTREARKVVADSCAGHADWEVRALSAQVCSAYGEYASGKLRVATKDKDLPVRSAAYRALAGHRKRATIAFLIDAMKSEAEARRDIQWALERLTGKDLGDDHSSWNAWWQPVSETFELPSPEKAKQPKKNDERKSLGTAVREGLYGPISSERVAFLFDVSGSMSVGIEGEGTRLRIAKNELQRVLENQLSSKAYFNIITFSEKVGAFGPRLQKASKSKLRRAAKYVEKLRAAGETNAFGALGAAFEDKDIDTIYLLSDGQPTVGDETDPAEIHKAVAEWNQGRGVVVHCIGFFPGSAKNQDKKVAREFLRQLAHCNGGVYLEIY